MKKVEGKFRRKKGGQNFAHPFAHYNRMPCHPERSPSEVKDLVISWKALKS